MGNINTNYLHRQQLVNLNEKPVIKNNNEVKENKKEKNTKNGKKIALALAGLAAIGLTAVAIKTGAAQTAGKYLKDKIGTLGKKTAEAGTKATAKLVTTEAAKAATTEVAKATTTEVAKATTTEIAKVATTEIAKVPIQGVLPNGLAKSLRSAQALATYGAKSGGHAAAEEVLKGVSGKKLKQIMNQPAFERLMAKLQENVGRGNTETARKLAEKALSSGNRGEQIAGAKFLLELAKNL